MKNKQHLNFSLFRVMTGQCCPKYKKNCCHLCCFTLSFFSDTWSQKPLCIFQLCFKRKKISYEYWEERKQGNKKQGNRVTIIVNHNSFLVNGLVRKSTSIFCLLCIPDIRAWNSLFPLTSQTRLKIKSLRGFSEKILKIHLHWKSKINSSTGWLTPSNFQQMCASTANFLLAQAALHIFIFISYSLP